MATSGLITPKQTRHISPWVLSVLLLTIAYGLLGLTFTEPLSHASIMQRCVLVNPKMARIWSVGNVEIGLAYFGVFTGMVGYFVQIFRHNRGHLTDLFYACLYLTVSFLIDFICVSQFSPFVALLIGDAIVMTFTVIISRHVWFQRLLGVFVPIIFLTCGMGHFLEGLSYWHMTYQLNVPWTMVTADIGFAVLVNSARFPAFIRGQDVVEELKEANLRAAELDQQLTVIMQAEETRLASEALYQATFEQAAVGMANISLSGKIAYVNDKLCSILGYSREELLEKTFPSITHPEDIESVNEMTEQLIDGSISSFTLEKRYIHKDSSLVWINLTKSIVRTSSGAPNYFISIIEDITERKRLEHQLLQAQKLESIGRLSGGVAHDFNNLLTVIMGSVELAEGEIPKGHPIQVYLDNIQHASERAANLTRQLLAFARKQVIAPRSVDLNSLMLSTDQMLRVLIGEHIQLAVLPGEGLHAVHVDPGQFEQILVNLVVNARDAMPNGGKITIETCNVVFDEEYAQSHEGATAGEYVMLAVSDTGTGMEEAVRLHVFEPFFTTKEQGRGTGLGLATVYGIVKQSNGHIWLYSELEKGTTFKIFLPRSAELVSDDSGVNSVNTHEKGHEVILLVEDEESVRSLAAQVLKMRGYTVIEAGDGEEALRLTERGVQDIALMITDVVMPLMSGKELADKLTVLYPNMKILFVSGYTESTIVHNCVLEPGVVFLSKPFTSSQLTSKVREILDSRTMVGYKS